MWKRLWDLHHKCTSMFLYGINLQQENYILNAIRMACGLMAKIERYRKQSQESGDWMNEKLPWRTLNAKIRFVHIFQLECIYFAYIYFYCRHLLYSASSSSSFSSSYKAKFMFDNTLIECTQNPFNSRFRPQRKLLRKWKIKMKNENVCVCGVYTYQLFEVLHYG